MLHEFQISDWISFNIFTTNTFIKVVHFDENFNCCAPSVLFMPLKHKTSQNYTANSFLF